MAFNVTMIVEFFKGSASDVRLALPLLALGKSEESAKSLMI